MSLPSAASNALDFQGFHALRRDARERRQATAGTVARQFESLILQMMVRSMRQATPGDPLFSSSASRLYRDLFDQQLALRLSETRSVGLADTLLGQLRASGALGEQARSEPDALRPLQRGLFPSRSGPPREAGTATPASGEAEALDPFNGASPFAGREAFVRAVRPHAEQAGRTLGVDPDLLLAQAALETGWGRSVLRHPDGSSTYNLFNIKAGRSWSGDVVTLPALEYEGGIAVRRQAAFRAYRSLAESFQDYVTLVQGSERYAQALARARDPRAYIRELQAGGYATDPAYADKVIRIWEEHLGGGVTVAAR
jgi:flagellar protein FlgJ